MSSADSRGLLTSFRSDWTSGQALGAETANRCLSCSFSSRSRFSSFLKAAFSAASFSRSSAKVFIVDSNLFIRAFFRSRANWAASRFFIFRLLIFSSCDIWLRFIRIRFLGFSFSMSMSVMSVESQPEATDDPELWPRCGSIVVVVDTFAGRDDVCFSKHAGSEWS